MNIRPQTRLRSGHCRVSNIAYQVDRSTMTIIRWEKEGLIPKAKRDSRDWRIYTEDQVRDIVNLVRNTKYFSQ